MTQTLVEAMTAHRLNSPTIHRLSNGLTIVAEQMPVDAVNLSLWLGVGSAVESNAINGMAHFLEHMVFKGTAQLKSGEFEQLIEQRGAVTNAATSQDYTHYYIATAPQDFTALAPYQIDVVLNAAIPDDAFERERQVILEEIRRANDNPQRRTYYRAMEAAFDQLPYRRPVLGPEHVIENLTPQQMRDFHATWYQPQSITAVAVGNLPVEQLVETIAESFATCGEPAGTEAIATPDLLTHEAESPFTEIRRCDYTDPTLQQARLVMMWRVPGMAHLPQTYALDVLASVLGQGRTSRLVRDLREDRRWVTSISVSNVTYTRQGLFYISAQLAPEHLVDVEQAILQHIHQVRHERVSDAEINRVRTLVANRYIFGNETPSDRAGIYGYYQAVVGDLTPALLYPTHIQCVEASDIQAAAEQYLSPDGYAIVTIRPAS